MHCGAASLGSAPRDTTLTLPAPVTRPLLGVGQGGEVRSGLELPGVTGPGCPRETGEPRLQVPDTLHCAIGLHLQNTNSKKQLVKVSIWQLLLLLSHFSCVRLSTLCDPTDGSPPGFPIPGILQARTLEWVAISFSNA